MIAVAASAVLAILFDEPEAADFRRILVRGGGVISPVNHWEVLARAHVELGDEGLVVASDLLGFLGVKVAVISSQHARLTADAFKRFGKRSAAKLNLGDCCAHALAQIEGEGLGRDLPKTDVKSATG